MTGARPRAIFVCILAAVLLGGCAQLRSPISTPSSLAALSSATNTTQMFYGNSTLETVSVAPLPNSCTGITSHENGVFNVTTPSKGRIKATWQAVNPTTAMLDLSVARPGWLEGRIGTSPVEYDLGTLTPATYKVQVYCTQGATVAEPPQVVSWVVDLTPVSK